MTWAKKHPAAIAAAQKRWATSHPDQVARRRRARVDSGKSARDSRNAYWRNPDRYRAAMREWGQKNLPRILDRRRKQYASDLRYRLQVKLYNQAQKFDPAHVSLTVDDALSIWADYDGRCAYCFGLATTLDHVLPRRRGGKHEIGNVVPACRPCNSSKHTRTPAEWLGGTPGGKVFVGEGLALPFGP